MVPGDASSVVSVNPAKPLISVCIPMYNNGATIERCLRSILEQEGVEFEIVVVDDDSSDDCAAIAATMLRPGDRLLRNEPRLGLNRNHNKCLEVARGGLIQFVHGDDRLLPEPCRHSADVLRIPVSEWLSPPTGGERRHQVATTVRQGPYPFPQAARPQPRAVAGLADGIARREGKLDRRTDRRDVSAAIGAGRRWFSHRYLPARRCGLLASVDAEVGGLLRSARALGAPSHGGDGTTRVMATRRNVLDRQRILTWLIVDPLSPNSVRSAAALWWIPAWLAMIVEVAVLDRSGGRT